MNKRLVSIISVVAALLGIVSIAIVSSADNAPSSVVKASGPTVAFVGEETNAPMLLAMLREQRTPVSIHSTVPSSSSSPASAVVFDTEWLAANGDQAEFLTWLRDTTLAGKFVAAYGTETHLLFDSLLKVHPDLFSPGRNPAQANAPLVGIKWISEGRGFGPLIVIVDSSDPLLQALKISEMAA